MSDSGSRYNLKRRTAALLPLTTDEFTQKVQANQDSAAAAVARVTFNKSCESCQKTYYSVNSYNNHVASQKHKANEAKAQEDSQPKWTSQENPPKAIEPLTDCLFCNYRSPRFELNVDHMHRFHGLFIPEQDFLDDGEGLLKYLRAKIEERHQCLYCHKNLHSALGSRAHMRDRGHCMLSSHSLEDVAEYGQFYDFRSTYPDAKTFEDLLRKVGSELSEERAAAEVERQNEADANEDGWETDSTLSDVPTDEITSVPIEDRSHQYKLLPRSRHHAHGDPRPHHNADGWHSHAHPTPTAVYHDDFELYLPSGRKAGHRSLNRYYRQNLRRYPTAVERMQRRALTTGSGELEQPGRGRQVGRSRGDLSLVGVSASAKAAVEKEGARARRVAQRASNQNQAAVERKSNFQKHFRVSFFVRCRSVLTLAGPSSAVKGKLFVSWSNEVYPQRVYGRLCGFGLEK